MPYTERFTEGAELLAKVDPQTIAVATNTAWVSLANFHRFMVIVQIGAINGGMDVDLYEATSTAGDDTQWFTDHPVTAADDNQVIVFDFRCEQLTVNSDYDCIRLQLEPDPQATAIVCAQIWGLEPRFRAVATTLVDTIVTA